MQACFHNIDRTDVGEFPAPTYSSGPFVTFNLYDHQGSEFTVYLKSLEDARKLYEAAEEAMTALAGIMPATV